MTWVCYQEGPWKSTVCSACTINRDALDIQRIFFIYLIYLIYLILSYHPRFHRILSLRQYFNIIKDNHLPELFCLIQFPRMLLKFCWNSKFLLIPIWNQEFRSLSGVIIYPKSPRFTLWYFICYQSVFHVEVFYMALWEQFVLYRTVFW